MQEKNSVSKRKVFNHKFVEFPDLKTISKNGKRHYVISGEEAYPSVTTVLDEMTDKTALLEWKKRVGEEEARRISSRSANRGTALHLACEKYLLNENIDFSKEMPTTQLLFKQVQPILDEKVDDIYCIESVLVSRNLKVAGRVDLIAEYDGEVAIVDFKTSDKTKKKEWIENYFMQTSLYAYMFWEMTGIPIKKIVIGICVESEYNPQIFIESPKNYIQKVANLVRAYHKCKEII